MLGLDFRITLVLPLGRLLGKGYVSGVRCLLPRLASNLMEIEVGSLDKQFRRKSYGLFTSDKSPMKTRRVYIYLLVSYVMIAQYLVA